MRLFEEFEQSLQGALRHLYDPTYQPHQVVWEVTGCNPRDGVERVQATIIRAIEDLSPSPAVPPTAPIRCIYELLYPRYIHVLTQEEAAARLGITPRHLRRRQREAVHVLAKHLWEQRGLGTPMEISPSPDETAQPQMVALKDTTSPEWLSQVRQELASLQVSSPGIVTDVDKAIRGAAQIGRTLAARQDVRLVTEYVEPNLSAAIHPSALRQALIAAIVQVTQCMSSGEITLRAERDDRHIKITMTAQPVAMDGLPELTLCQEILAVHGGSIEVSHEQQRTFIWMELPSSEEVIVLVIDDNADLVHFYQRYTTGTRYRIVHASEGQLVWEIIEAAAPGIIVLDVMLPDVDGWELLTHLRKNSATCSIPCVVCSVIREKELALALGAAVYVPKPVHRGQFIRALDQALSQAGAAARTTPANN